MGDMGRGKVTEPAPLYQLVQKMCTSLTEIPELESSLEGKNW